MDKFRKDAITLSGYLMNAEPFRPRIKDFNIRAVETPGEVTGVNKPHHGVYKRTPLSVHYSSFDSERYALTYDNSTVRNVASAVPYDLMVNWQKDCFVLRWIVLCTHAILNFARFAEGL